MKYLKLFEQQELKEEYPGQTLEQKHLEAIKSVNGIKNAIDEGWFNPGIEHGMLIRNIVKGTWKSIENYGESNVDVFKYLVDILISKSNPKSYKTSFTSKSGIAPKLVFKQAAEFGRIDLMDYLIQLGLIDHIDSMEEAKTWSTHSRKIPQDKKLEVNNYLESELDEIEYNIRKKLKNR